MRVPSNWAQVMAAKPASRGFARVYGAAGWSGGYKRKPPKGEHKCLNRIEMMRLLRKLEG